jgi:phosphoserine phosphatase
MLLALTLVSLDAATTHLAGERVGQAVVAIGARVKEPRTLGPGAVDWLVEADAVSPVRIAAMTAVADLAVDVCVQPFAGRRKRLFIADMDSTIIGCECLDELADFAGVKSQVAAITERAMRGEIAFEGALRERVAMLKGLPVAVLDQCYRERVRLNPGASTLVRTMAAHGVHCLLVSGGFESFTGPVAQAAGFAGHQANRLIQADGQLTGEVAEPILGREAKLEALQLHAAQLGLAFEDVLAVGDGANDLAMIEAAGLGVAYRAKPVVAAQADARVDHSDLTALLYFQGYEHDAFVAADPPPASGSGS